MKPLIAESVYYKLSTLDHPLAPYLLENLASAKVVDDTIFEESIVTLNSTVDYIEPGMRPVRIQIVLPDQEDLTKRKVSVLAPISIALLGFKEMDEIVIKTSAGKKKVKILKVQNYEN
ncbi:MAG: GreA/GreB family elongation factor [Bacteroidetes bacterium]|nr:GreA/GreB family elongation factor [Bacteroidota bacterium]